MTRVVSKRYICTFFHVLLFAIVVTGTFVSDDEDDDVFSGNDAGLFESEEATNKTFYDVYHWSSWASWSQCSRSCGIGISTSTRTCEKTRPYTNEPCLGKNRRYRTCETQDCDESAADFRQIQCANLTTASDHDGGGGLLKMAAGKDLRNVTNFNRCSLYCRLADDSGEVRRTAEKVIDGTRCYVEDQYGVCIDGSCEAVGCNKELHEEFKFDKCGVCGGDSSTCQLITGIFHPSFDRNTPELVAEIPIQSRKIIVSGEMDFDITTGDSNSSLLNTEQYNLSPPDDAVEPFSPRKVYKLDGPLANNARIMVKRQSGRKCPFLQGCPLDHGDDKPDPAGPGGAGTDYIRYEYYRPRTVMWMYNDTSAPCSATCGSGFRYVNPTCISIENLQVFPDSTCIDEGLPPASGQVRPCLLPLCEAPGHVTPENSDTMKFYHMAPVHYEYVKKPMWHSSSWSRCSVSCGGGVQRRTHSCEKKYLYQDEYESVPDAECSQLHMPDSVKTCNTFPCSTWHAGPWSSCSVSCGRGFQRRVIVCENENMNQNIQCNDAHMPSNRRKCYTSCKGTIAQIFAGTDDNPEDGDDNIPALIADNNAATPTAVGAFKPRWIVKVWSACSKTCGRGGIQFRSVKCMLKQAADPSRTTDQVSEDRCPDEKPFDEKECFLGMCPSPSMGELNRAPATATQPIVINADSETLRLYTTEIYFWAYEGWRPCSVTCGMGIQLAIAQCLHQTTGHLSSDDRCDQNTKLEPNLKNCGRVCPAPNIGINGSRWDIGLYGECSKTCGRGTRERKVVCKFIPENEEEKSTRTEEIMPEIMCPYPKPTQSEPCGLSACPPKWVLTDWGKCSKTCGGGSQERKRECRQLTGMGETITVSPMFCPKNIPKKRKYCHLGDCPPRYVAERWGGCRPPCIKGQGTQRRKVACKRMHKRRFLLLPAKHCKRLQKPPSQRRCNLGPKCFSSLGDSSSSTSPLPSRPPRPRLFVQHKRRKSPIYLTLPRRAVVFPGTTLIGKCGFKGVPPKSIQWFHKRRKLTTRRGRVMVTPTGSLRLNRVRARAAGAYRCTDGKSQSKFLMVQLRGSKTRAPPRRDELMKIDDVADESSDNYGTFIQTLTPFNRKNELVDQPSAGPNLVINSVADTRWRQQTSSLSNVGGDGDRSVRRNKQHRRYGRKFEFEYDYDNGLPDIISARSNYLGLKRRKLPVDKGPAFGESETEEISEEALNIESEKKSPSIEVHPTIDPLQTIDDIVTHVGGSLVVVGSQRVTILCEATGEQPIEYEWYKDERKIHNDGRLLKLQDGSLRIFQPQYTDAGRFVCVAQNQYGNDSRATVISVTNKPNILSTTEQVEDFVSHDLVVTVGSHIRAKLGARIVIRCPTEGSPEPYVEWRKDGPGLQRNSRILYDNSLELNPTSTADQGLFSCEATNPFGTSYQASSLVLIDPPHVSLADKVIPDSNDMDGLPELLNTDESNPEYRVKANSSVIMGCPLAGFPEPEIEWFYEGEKITNFGELLDFQLMFKNKVLQIPMANNHSVGLYSCKGTNDGGAVEISLRLNITVYKYALNGLTQCSESCGNSGTQRYQLVCMEDGIRQVEDWYCTGIERPELEEIPCNRIDCPPRYYAEPWSNCSVTCGNGTRTRSITCVVLMVDGSMREVSRASCESEKPVPLEEEACVEDPCPMWRAGEWRKCSKKCTGNGTGLTTRSVQCISHNGTVVHKSMCKHLPKPDKKQNCTNKRCTPVWRPSPWSVCSTSCGRAGIQTRILGCYYEGRQNQSAGTRCLAETRPPVSRQCGWRNCSKSKSKMRCRDRARICRRALVNRLPMCLNLKKRCCRTCS